MLGRLAALGPQDLFLVNSMFDVQSSFSQMLLPEESAQVDGALMSSRDKFSARVAIYSLRVLRQVAAADAAIAQVTPEQITDWLAQDPAAQESLDLDESFQSFYSRLILASVRPLTAAAEMAETTVAALTVDQIIAWFEAEARRKQQAGA
ncbi:hypothetical protein GEI7407_2233 [Geitlerinema sp. PCC 7407]|nr:hypothetical protein GEI7407_2233 [Geitlerinema sp. PCC 7407]